MIQVRTAVEADLEAMLEIYNDVIVNTTAVYDYEPHTLEMRRQWFRIKEAQGFPVFVAEENGRIEKVWQIVWRHDRALRCWRYAYCSKRQNHP